MAWWAPFSSVLALGPCITLNGIIGKHLIGANLGDNDEISVTNRLNMQSFFGILTFGFEQDNAVKSTLGSFYDR